MTVILRDLWVQAEWACACVAVSNFRHDESGKVGRRYGMTYTLDAPGEPDISMEVWRSQPETLGEDRQDCRSVRLADHRGEGRHGRPRRMGGHARQHMEPGGIMKAQTINEFRYDLHLIANRAAVGLTSKDDAERLRSISSSLVEIELMLEKMQSRWHNPQETVR